MKQLESILKALLNCPEATGGLQEPAGTVTPCRPGARTGRGFVQIASRTSWLIALLLLGVVIAGCSRASRTAARLEKANQHYAAGDYDKAEIEYMNVLRADRTNQVAFRNLGLIMFEQADFPRASGFLMAANQLNGQDPLVRLRLGQLFNLMDDGTPTNTLHLRARTNALFVLGQEPANDQALLVLLNSFRRGESAEAEKALERLRPTAGNTAGFQVASGLLQLRMTNQTDVAVRLAGSEAAFRKAISLSATNVAAHAALADVLMARARLAGMRNATAEAEALAREAEQNLKKAADLSPIRAGERLRYVTFKLGTARSTNELEEAKAILKEMTVKAPDYAPALLELAELNFRQGEFDECGRLVQQVLSRRPHPGIENSSARFLEARLQLAQKEIERAMGTLDKLTQTYPMDPRPHLGLAQLFASRRETDKAIASAARAVTLSRAPGSYSTYLDASFLLADLRRRRDESRTAVEILQGILARLPEMTNSPGFPKQRLREVESQARLKLVDAFAGQGQLANAMQEANVLAKANPTNAMVWYVQGMLHGMQTNAVEARRCFGEALRIAPRYYEAADRLNQLDLMEKNPAAAIARTEQLAAADTNSPVPHHMLGTVHFLQRDFAKAEVHLQKALEMAPDFSPAYTLLAQVYVATQRVPEAIQRLNAAVASRTNNVGAMLQIAGIHTYASNYTAARDMFERVLKISTNNLPALNDLAYLYSERLGDQDRALVLAQRAHALVADLPERPETERYVYAATDTLGWVHYRRGDYAQALTLLKESAEHLPFDAEVAYHLGMTYYMLGEEAAATTYLQRAVNTPSGTQFSGLATAKERLDLLQMNSASADAKTRLEKELAGRPDDPVVMARLAALLEREGAYERAATLYEKYVAKNPKALVPMVRLAGLYAGPLRAPEKALVQARNAYKLNPDRPQTLAELGRAVCQAGDYTFARNLLAEAVRGLPNDPEVALDIATVSFAMGQLAPASAALQRALAAGTNLTRMAEARNLQVFLSAVRSPAGAGSVAAAVQEALAKNPDDVPALLTAAVVQEQAGRAEAAVAQYEKVLQKVPGCVFASRQVALLYAGRLNDPKKAYEPAVAAREAFPDDPLVAKTLGVLVCQRADYGRAAQLLTEAGRKLEGDPELHYYLGLAQFHLKQRDPSKASLNKALSLNLAPALASEAKRMLGELK